MEEVKTKLLECPHMIVGVPLIKLQDGIEITAREKGCNYIQLAISSEQVWNLIRSDLRKKNPK